MISRRREHLSSLFSFEIRSASLLVKTFCGSIISFLLLQVSVHKHFSNSLLFDCTICANWPVFHAHASFDTYRLRHYFIYCWNWFFKFRIHVFNASEICTNDNFTRYLNCLPFCSDRNDEIRTISLNKHNHRLSYRWSLCCDFPPFYLRRVNIKGDPIRPAKSRAQVVTGRELRHFVIMSATTPA